MARGRLILPVLFAGGLVAGSCADEARPWDPALVPAAVAAEVAPIGITEVSCPAVAGIDPESGGSTRCEGILNGDGVELDVAVAPAIDGVVDVAADLVTPVLDVGAVESSAAVRLDADLGGSPEIDCAERLVVIAPERRIECRVTAAGGTAGPVDQPLAIVILDADGNWEIDLLG